MRRGWMCREHSQENVYLPCDVALTSSLVNKDFNITMPCSMILFLFFSGIWVDKENIIASFSQINKMILPVVCFY